MGQYKMSKKYKSLKGRYLKGRENSWRKWFKFTKRGLLFSFEESREIWFVVREVLCESDNNGTCP